jgi:DegV family protein with EDD domain
MTIRLVTDSTCDLPDEIIGRYAITVVPAYINVGQKSYQDSVDLSRDEFYRNLGSWSTHPTTAAPSSGVFAEVYERLAAEGATAIVSIHVSAQLSGFCNSARLGAEEAPVPVHVVDSQQVAMGLGLLVMAAADAVEQGQSAAGVVATVEDRRNRTTLLAGFDTLEYLQKGGRVSGLQAMLGSLLKIKPILQVKDGLVQPFDKVRTRKRLVPRLTEVLEQMGPLEELVVLYTGDSADAEAFYQAVSHRFPAGSKRLLTLVGPAVGVHAGPGALGFAVIKKA